MSKKHSRNPGRALRWTAAGILALGFALGTADSAAAPADPLNIIADRERGDKLLDQNKPAEAVALLEGAFKRGVQAINQKKKLSGDEFGNLVLIAERLSTGYALLGRFQEAADRYDFFLTIKTELGGKVTAQERARLQYLKDRAAGKSGAATTTPAARPAPAANSLSDQLDALGKIALSHDASQGIALIESIQPRIAQASVKDRLRFYGLAGQVYADLMRFTLADEMFTKALTEAEGSKDEDALVTALTDLGRHYTQTGDYARSEQLLLRAKPIAERKGVFSSGLLATAMANNYSSMGQYAKALQIVEAAYEAALKQASSPDDLTLVVPRFTLSRVLDEMGEYARAEKLLFESKATFEKMGVAGTMLETRILEALGWHYRAAKDYRKSIEYYDKRMQLLLRHLPPDSLQVAHARCQMAETFWVAGDSARAVPLGIQCNDTKEQYLAAVLASGAEDQRRAYVSTLLHETDVTVSVHVQGHKTDARLGRFALDTVLRRKGRVLDAMADTMAKARASMSAEDRARLDRLATVRTSLSSAAMAGGDKANTALMEEARKLEAELSKNADFRLQASPISTEAVQKALPEGSALVELISYRPYDFKAKLSESHAAPEYVAYVLTRTGEPKFVVLGKVAAVDAELDAFRQALSKNQDVKASARKVDALVMQPIRALLGDLRQVFLSPDGALNLIPYAALVDENGKYLVENYSFTYLTTGRDLLRFGNRASPGTQVAVFANPDYQTQGAEASASGARRSAALNLRQVQPLPGTAEEARAIARVIPQARVLSEQQATESAVKSVKSPRVLHIATHGFFVGETGASNGTRALELEMKEQAHQTLRDENPLLRSGLLFSGAAVLKGGSGEDGVLTALEASSLDLRGTGLVVMSACQTAVGEVRSGDGVYGLRRALTLAGAESIVMSLWSVDDEGTRELMSQYYRRLEAGQGRSEALRQVQLSMLKDKKWESPYFWAAFIPAGDPAPMEFPDPDRPTRTPSYVRDTGTSRERILNTPSIHWIQVSAGIAQLSMEATDTLEAGSETGARAQIRSPLLSRLLVQRKTLRLHDRAAGQIVYSGDGKSATEWSYDAMLGFQTEDFGLFAGVRYGMGKAKLGELSNGGSFFPGAVMLRSGGFEVTGWTGNLAAERAVTGVLLSYPISKGILLDGGWQKSKGRNGESPSTSITHLGLSMTL